MSLEVEIQPFWSWDVHSYIIINTYTAQVFLIKWPQCGVLLLVLPSWFSCRDTGASPSADTSPHTHLDGTPAYSDGHSSAARTHTHTQINCGCCCSEAEQTSALSKRNMKQPSNSEMKHWLRPHGRFDPFTVEETSPPSVFSSEQLDRSLYRTLSNVT